LQTSAWTITVSNSVRTIAPVGHASMQPAFVQCLQTSDMKSHLSSGGDPASAICTRSGSPSPAATAAVGIAGSSMKRTWRHVEAERRSVWS
jgi:hypothetical protein